MSSMQCLKLSKKSCRSSCLESQIINKKLKKNQQKVPSPPPKLSALDRRTCGNFQHWFHVNGLNVLSLAQSNTVSVPLLMYWSYLSLSLSHQYQFEPQLCHLFSKFTEHCQYHDSSWPCRARSQASAGMILSWLHHIQVLVLSVSLWLGSRCQSEVLL